MIFSTFFFNDTTETKLWLKCILRTSIHTSNGDSPPINLPFTLIEGLLTLLRVIRPFWRAIHPYRRVINPYRRIIHPYRRVIHPYRRVIHHSRRAIHPIHPSIDPFWKVNHPYRIFTIFEDDSPFDKSKWVFARCTFSTVVYS
jgi:hypothetical protein